MAEKKQRQLYGPEREAQERKERLTDAEVAAQAEAEAAAQSTEQRSQSPTKESLVADRARRATIERAAHEQYMRDNASPEKFATMVVPEVVIPPEVLARRAERTAKYRRQAEETVARSERLREQRALAGLTQVEAAHLARVHIETVRDLEQGVPRGEEVTARVDVAYALMAKMAPAQQAALERAVAAAQMAGMAPKRGKAAADGE